MALDPSNSSNLEQLALKGLTASCRKLQTDLIGQRLKRPKIQNSTRTCDDDVLPLKACTRRNTLANLHCFSAPRHLRPNFDDVVYIHYTAPPYSARISTIYLLPFGKVWLGSVCRVQCLVTKQNAKFTEGG